MTPSELPAIRALQREQTQLRAWLAAVLLMATCAFALFLSWLAQDTPLRPLLSVRASFYGLLLVYGISVSVAAIYARWIRSRREPALRAAANNQLEAPAVKS